jgi:putative redox protein
MATMILSEATVTGVSGYAQAIASGGHVLNSDEPLKRGGTNTGPAPFDLMLSSLGACTAITLRMYSERKEWKLGTIDVKLRLLKQGEDPLRIERTISTTGPLDADQRTKLLEIADKTPVTKALSAGVKIETTLE